MTDVELEKVRYGAVLGRAAIAASGAPGQKGTAGVGRLALCSLQFGHVSSKRAMYRARCAAVVLQVRTAIVIKTYTALIRKHSAMSDEEQLRELRTVKKFAHLLFANVRGPDETRCARGHGACLPWLDLT